MVNMETFVTLDVLLIVMEKSASESLVIVLNAKKPSTVRNVTDALVVSMVQPAPKYAHLSV